MADGLQPGEVLVAIHENFKDPETQYAYYNGSTAVVDGPTASRMVNEFNVSVVEEGPVAEDAQARHDAMMAAQEPSEASDTGEEQSAEEHYNA